ncbi:YceD family protein [Massilia sp.]|uniref:YceD family protein n=1 Tax=Massilia sp. TaxID=1882437 RepID=UPI003919B7D3
MSAFVIDAFEFCRNSGHREGTTPVAEMSRLAAECADGSGEASGEIRWAIDGSLTKQGYPAMTLSVAGTVKLACQRCLAPFEYEIDSSTMLVLGKDDEDADAIEEILDDESIDVIVGSRECDIRQLLEDEALLALPQAPKHEVCPDTQLLDALKTEKVSPFAALKNLKSE